MLRAVFAATVLVGLTVGLLPLQAVAVARNWAIQRRLPRLYHRLVCRLLGVRVFVFGTPPICAPQNSLLQNSLLIVSNHASWIDISVIGAALPVVFVAKSEVAHWPVLGLLARLQRSVFVDRARRSATRSANGRIAGRLAGGDHVVLFAEGTSSDGNRVLPFRSALIGAAGDALALGDGDAAHIILQPLSIAYVGLHGVAMGRHHRALAAWYGSSDFLPHLGRVLRQGTIDVVLTWGEPIRYTPSSDRKAVAGILEKRVRDLTSRALRSDPRLLPTSNLVA